MTLIYKSSEKQQSHDAYPEPHTASSGSTHHLVFRLQIKQRAITEMNSVKTVEWKWGIMSGFVAKSLHIFLCVAAAGNWISKGPSHRLCVMNRNPELESIGRSMQRWILRTFMLFRCEVLREKGTNSFFLNLVIQACFLFSVFHS